MINDQFNLWLGEYLSSQCQIELAPKELRKILHAILLAITDCVRDGDEVRLHPWGMFYPKVIQKNGRFSQAKLGFVSFAATNRRISGGFPYDRIFSSPSASSARFYTSGGSFRVEDAEGRELFNLSQIARMSGICLPTARKYLKAYRSLIQVADNQTGKRYRREVVDVFRSIKSKNTSVSRLQGGDAQLPAAPADPSQPLSMTDVARLSPVSIITLYKYIRKYPDRIFPSSISEDGNRVYSWETVLAVRSIKTQNLSRWGGQPPRSSGE